MSKGNWLPTETLDAYRKYLVGIKGPLTTPVGGGIRSLNVALRQELDLYVCLRPVRYFAVSSFAKEGGGFFFLRGVFVMEVDFQPFSLALSPLPTPDLCSLWSDLHDEAKSHPAMGWEGRDRIMGVCGCRFAFFPFWFVLVWSLQLTAGDMRALSGSFLSFAPEKHALLLTRAGRAVAGEAPGGCGHGDLPREHGGHLRRH